MKGLYILNIGKEWALMQEPRDIVPSGGRVDLSRSKIIAIYNTEDEVATAKAMLESELLNQ